MRQTGHPDSTIIFDISGSPSDETSLIISAPASKEENATEDLLVSIEIPMSGNSSLID